MASDIGNVTRRGETRNVFQPIAALPGRGTARTLHRKQFLEWSVHRVAVCTTADNNGKDGRQRALFVMQGLETRIILREHPRFALRTDANARTPFPRLLLFSGCSVLRPCSAAIN